MVLRKRDNAVKLGTSTSVLYRYSIWDAIRLVARAGYDGVDIWGGRPHVYRRDLSVTQLKQLRREIEDLGLRVSSFMPAFYRYPHSLGSPSSEIRDDSIAYMFECIESAITLGTDTLLVIPDHSLNGQTKDDCLKRTEESIDAIARHASQYDGLKLGLEVLYYDETDIVNCADDALRIVKDLGHSNIGVVLDTGTINLSKEPLDGIFTALDGLVLQVHVNDNAGVSRQQNLIPGEGTYDFKELIRFLHSRQYTGFLSAELSKEYADDPETALRTTAERLRGWMEA
jgi:protein FrlC